MRRTRDLAIATVGWCCLAAFAAAWIAGRGKTPVDYAASSLQPLPLNQPLGYDDNAHAIWSGWWMTGNGFRMTNAVHPAVVFLASRAARDCRVTIAAFPLSSGSERSQRIYASLNGQRPAGPYEIATEGKIVISTAGDLVDGVNVLRLRLPDAHKTNVMDERVESIAVRSIAFSCVPD